MVKPGWPSCPGCSIQAIRRTCCPTSCSAKGFNGGCYQNSQVDQLMDSALKITDLGERGAIYRQIQQIVADDAPWIFVYNQIQNMALSTRVNNLKLHPSFYLTYLNQISVT